MAWQNYMSPATSSESVPKTTYVQRGKEFVVIEDPTVVEVQNFSSLLTQDVLLELGEVNASWFTCQSPTIAFSPTKSDDDYMAPDGDEVNFTQVDSQNPLSDAWSPVFSRPTQCKEWDNISDHQCLNTPPKEGSNSLLKTPHLYGVSPMAQYVGRGSNLRHSTPHNVSLSLGATMGGHELSWSSSMATPILNKSMDNSMKGNSHIDDNCSKLKKPAIPKKLFNSQSHLENETNLDSVTIISLGDRGSSDEYCLKLENTPIRNESPCDVACQRIHDVEMKNGTKAETLSSPLLMPTIWLDKPEASSCSTNEQEELITRAETENVGIPAPISCYVSENTPKRPKLLGFKPPARNVMLDLQAETSDGANRGDISLAIPDDSSTEISCEESTCSLLTSTKEHNMRGKLLEDTTVSLSTMCCTAVPSIFCQPPAATIPPEPLNNYELTYKISSDCAKAKCISPELAASPENGFHLAEGNEALKDKDNCPKLNTDEVVSPKLPAYTGIDNLQKEYLQLENMIVAEPIFAEDSNSSIMPMPSLKELLPNDVDLPLGPCAMKVDSNSTDVIDFKSIIAKKNCREGSNTIENSNEPHEVEMVVEDSSHSSQRDFAKLDGKCEQTESCNRTPNVCAKTQLTESSNSKLTVLESTEPNAFSETRIQNDNIYSNNDVNDVLEDQDDDLFLNICSFDVKTKLQSTEKNEVLDLQFVETDNSKRHLQHCIPRRLVPLHHHIESNKSVQPEPNVHFPLANRDDQAQMEFKGFSLASGKSVKLSAAAMQKANQLFKEGDWLLKIPEKQLVLRKEKKTPDTCVSLSDKPSIDLIKLGLNVESQTQTSKPKTPYEIDPGITEVTCIADWKNGMSTCSKDELLSSSISEHQSEEKLLTDSKTLQNAKSVCSNEMHADFMRESNPNRSSEMISREDEPLIIDSKQIEPCIKMPQIACKGFSTASGKPVLTSKAAMDKARSIFLDEMSPQINKFDECPEIGDFKDDVLIEERPGLSKLHNSNSIICQGFSTASGKPLLLSKTALENAQSMFKEDGLLVSEPLKIPVSSIVNRSEFKKVEEESTLGNDKGEEAFHSRKRYSLPNLVVKKKDSKTPTFIPAKLDSAVGNANSFFPTFSLASGRQVHISKSALEKAKSMFHEEGSLAEQTVTNSTTSAPLLMFVKNDSGGNDNFKDVMVAVDECESKSIDHSTKAFPAFLTASGKRAPVSADALQQAQASLAGDNYIAVSDSSQESDSSQQFPRVPNLEDGSGDGRFQSVSKSTNANAALNAPLNSVAVGNICNKRAFATVDPCEQDVCKRMRCSTPVSKQTMFISVIDPRSSLKSEIHSVNCGFSLASGRDVVVSEKSLQAARSLFADYDPPELGLQVVPSSPHSGVKDDSLVLCPIGDWSSLSEEFSHDMLNEEDTILAEKSCNIHSSSEVPSNMVIDESHSGKLSEIQNQELSTEIMESTDALLADEMTSTPGLGGKRSSSWLSPVMGRPKNLFPCEDAYNSSVTPSRNSVLESDNSVTTVSENHCFWRSVPSKSLSHEIQQMRMVAVEEQLMSIEKRKRVKVSPVPGVFWKRKIQKESKQSLRDIVNGKLPKRICQNEELIHGVKMSTLKIQSFNAGDYQFLWEEHYDDSHLDSAGIALGNGSRLIFSEKNLAGKKEFYRAFLDTPGVDSKLINENWVFNHYRWIVWKLAAMEVSFPNVFGGRLLTPAEVMLRLHYRYNCEIDFSQRSALKKIMERDDTPAKTLVLCVVGIDEQILKYADSTLLDDSARNDACAAKYIELTDGWYSIKAIIDSPLIRLIKSGQICIGQKLIIHGAELVGSTEACPPLEAPPNLALKICANCCRRAKWDTKLGYLTCPKPFPLPLMSFFPDGGLVGCINVVVARIYPVQYLEKRDDGTSTVYNDRTNNRAALQFDNRKSILMEKIFLDVQSKFDCDENKREQTSRRSFNNNSWREEIKGLVSGDEIFKALENSADPSLIEDSLTSTQRAALTNYKETLFENKRTEFQAEIQRAMDNENEKCVVAREVIPFLKFRAIGTLSKDLRNSTGCLITLWRPGSDIFSMLKEGKALCIYYLMAESRSFSSMRQQELHLKSTKLTKFEEKYESDDVLLRTFTPRILTSLDSIGILEFSPPFSELDIIGLIVQIDYQEQSKFDFMYLADANLNIAVIKFWGGLKTFGLDNCLKCGDFLLASNIQWRGKVPSSEYKYLYATEFSSFSQHPKDESYKRAFNQFQNSFENANSFVEKAKEKISCTRKQHVSTPQQHYFGKPSSTSTPLTHSSGANGRFDTPPASVELVQQRFGRLSKYGTPPSLPNIVTNNTPSLKSEFRTPTFLTNHKQIQPQGKTLHEMESVDHF